MKDDQKVTGLTLSTESGHILSHSLSLYLSRMLSSMYMSLVREGLWYARQL